MPARWSDHVITGYPTDPVVRPIPPEREYGTHTPEGILVLAGPHIREGTTLEAAQIVDVVPTLLAWLGLPLPAHLDGQVCTAAWETPPQIRYTEPEITAEQESASPDYTAEEAEDVMQRLRDLGYL